MPNGKKGSEVKDERSECVASKILDGADGFEVIIAIAPDCRSIAVVTGA